MIIRSKWCGITTTLETFFTLLSAGFIQRAFIIGTIIAVLSSILSVFVVLKRVSLIGDGLAHTAFGGLALGYYLSSLGYFSIALGNYLDVFPIWVAAVVVVLGSIGRSRNVILRLLDQCVGRNRRHRLDSDRRGPACFSTFGSARCNKRPSLKVFQTDDDPLPSIRDHQRCYRPPDVHYPRHCFRCDYSAYWTRNIPGRVRSQETD